MIQANFRLLISGDINSPGHHASKLLGQNAECLEALSLMHGPCRIDIPPSELARSARAVRSNAPMIRQTLFSLILSTASLAVAGQTLPESAKVGPFYAG